MSLGQRIAISIFAILTFFAINIGTYFWGSQQRSEGLLALQLAIGGQLKANETKQLLENKHKEILILNTLKDTNTDPLTDGKIEHFRQGIAVIKGRIDSLEHFSSKQTQSAFTLLSQRFTSLEAIWLRFLAEYNAGLQPYSMEKLTNGYSLVYNGLSAFQSKESKNAEQQTVQINKTIHLTDQINIIVFLSSIFLTSTLGFVLIRYTNRSLHQLEQGVKHVSEGDLSYRIPEFSRDELGTLAKAFNEMSSRLSKAIGQVQRAKDTADQANKAKSIFLANMSHELRTPLNAIIGYSEMIHEDIEADPNIRGEEVAPDIEKVWTAGKHLLMLINDILDLSKIESGKMQLNNEWFNPNEVIAEVIATIRPIADANRNVIHPELSDTMPTLYADVTKFRQVLYNLLSNASKFSTEGKISVRSDVLNSKGLDYVQFAVKDSGIGMTEEQTQNIFDSFVQADLSTTKRYGGTGLGLAISKQFCQLMGGELYVRSAIGKGTTFYLELPLTDLPESASIAQWDNAE